MLFRSAKKRESQIIFRLINEVDPAAFVSQSAVIGVYGEGFDRFKVHGPQASSVAARLRKAVNDKDNKDCRI